MKKILIFNPGCFIYGAERGLVNFIKALKGRFKITVVLPCKGPLAEKLKELDKDMSIKVFPLGVIRFSFSPLYYIGFIFAAFLNIVYFTFYVIFNKVDMVCSNSLILPFPVIIAKLSGRKSIWFIREFFSFKLLNLILGKYAAWFCDSIVCQSKAIKEELGLGHKAKVVYEPLDKDNYTLYSYSSAKEKLGLPLETAVIALISRIHPSKGQYEFIKAIKDVLKKSKDLSLVIAGDISAGNLKSRLYKRSIMNLVKKEALENIYFLGYVKDISRVICASDVCVFAFKRKEPFGIAVAEALSFNKEVFFPLTGGLKEVRRFFNKGNEAGPEKIIEAAFKAKRLAVDTNKEFNIPEELSFSKYKNNLLEVIQEPCS